MGKNRQKTTTPKQNINLEEFAYKIGRWELGGKGSPTKEMTPEELRYMKEHEETVEYKDKYGRPINHLFRLDRVTRYNKEGSASIDDVLREIKVGDKLGDVLPKDSAQYRSFSDDVEAHYNYVSSHPWESAILLRTHGNVKKFDPRKYADAYPGEKEVWVDKSNLKIDNLTRLRGDDVGDDLKKILGVNSMYDVAQTDVLLIDVSPVGDNSYNERPKIWDNLEQKYRGVHREEFGDY